MDNKHTEDIIPGNSKGAKTDSQYSVKYESHENALSGYKTAKQRLLNISNWHKYAGNGTVDFQLTDNEGNAVTRRAEKGDHFRINIPGPGSKTGEGYDWVQIESILEESKPEEEIEYTAIKVRPATNPQNQKQDIAHFFKEDASSTFMVKRTGQIVSAEVHGRNEQPNTSTESIIDKARNIMVAAGALLGLSDVQWKSLVKGLLDTEKFY